MSAIPAKPKPLNHPAESDTRQTARPLGDQTPLRRRSRRSCRPPPAAAASVRRPMLMSIGSGQSGVVPRDWCATYTHPHTHTHTGRSWCSTPSQDSARDCCRGPDGHDLSSELWQCQGPPGHGSKSVRHHQDPPRELRPRVGSLQKDVILTACPLGCRGHSSTPVQPSVRACQRCLMCWGVSGLLPVSVSPALPLSVLAGHRRRRSRRP